MQNPVSLPNYLEKPAFQYRLDKARRLSSRTVHLDAETYAARHLYILDKRKRLVPFVYNAAQQHYHAHQTPRDLILKARQMGFSTQLQGEGYQRVTTQPTAAVVICHDDKTTQKMRRMQQRFYANHPGVKPARKFDNATVTTYPDTDSELEIFTAGSTEAGRGGSYTFVHGSEVAYWKDADAIMSGLMQGVPYGEGRIILESTANGAQGWFYERCMEALSGEGQWTLHFYPWWWDETYRIPLDDGEVLTYTPEEQEVIAKAARGGFTLTPEHIQWRRAKQAELPHTFAQEYPEDIETAFLTSGNSYFGDIEGCYVAPVDAKPDPSHEYVGGLDFGQTVDYTVLCIGDKTTRQEVALLRINQQPWQDMRRQIADLAKQWNCSVVWGEANSMGTTNIELLQRGETLPDGTKLYEGIPLMPFSTDSQTKPAAVQGLHHALHHGGLQLLPNAVGRAEMRNFVSRQTANGHWVYEAETGHDDIVIARMLMWYACHTTREARIHDHNPFFDE